MDPPPHTVTAQLGTHAPVGWAGIGRPASSSCGRPHTRRPPWRARPAGQCQSQHRPLWWCLCKSDAGVSRKAGLVPGGGGAGPALGTGRPCPLQLGSAACQCSSGGGGCAGYICMDTSALWAEGRAQGGPNTRVHIPDSQLSNRTRPRAGPPSPFASTAPPIPGTEDHTHLLTGFLMPWPSEPSPSPSFQPIFINIW